MNFSTLYRKVSTQMFLLLVCIAVLALYGTAKEESECTEVPCRCCKMQCWGSVAKSVSHALGHIPGAEGEQEALATLKLIRECMIQECASICTRKVPFRPQALAAILEARKQLQENQ